jgi:hypothetical protein
MSKSRARHLLHSFARSRIVVAPPTHKTKRH